MAKTNQEKPSVMQIDNDFTRQKRTEREVRASQETQAARAPKRYLGIIFLAVILVLTLPTVGLIRSYKNLQAQRLLNVQVAKKSASYESRVKASKDLIAAMKNSTYAAKFARKEYFYTDKDEKIFTTQKSEADKASGLPSSTSSSSSSK